MRASSRSTTESMCSRETSATWSLRDIGYSTARAQQITAPLEFDPQARPPSVKDWLATLSPSGGNKLRVAIGVGVSLILASVSVLLGVLLVGQRTPGEPFQVLHLLRLFRRRVRGHVDGVV